MDDMNPRFAPRRKAGGATTRQQQQVSSRSSYSPSSYNPNKKDWRSEHLEFQQMIREAKRDARASQPPSSSSYYAGGGGVASSTRYNSRTTTSGRNPTTRTSSSTYRGSQPVSTNSRSSHGAGFVARQPARRAPSSGAGGGGFSGGGNNNSRFSGIRDLSSGPSSSPGAPKQISILPTNDTSAGMWSALGRQQPTYGSYGQIGTRCGGARARAQQQNQSAGFW